MDGMAGSGVYAGHGHQEAEKHTITIQRHYRGYKGRRDYSTALWEKMEEQERERLEKQNRQIEEGYKLYELKEEQRKRDDDAMLSQTRSFKMEQSGEAPAARCAQRWFRRAHKRKTFIEHVEKRLQHCVEAIEADTSINQIIQRMKSVIQSNPARLKQMRQLFQSSDVSGAGLLPVDVFAADAKTIFGSTFSDTAIRVTARAFIDKGKRSIDYDIFLNYFEYDAISRLQRKLATYFQKVQIKEGTDMHDIFGIFDEEGNGLISREEFYHVLENFDLDFSKRDIDVLFQAFQNTDNEMCDYAKLVQSLPHVDRDTTGYEQQADITSYWQSLLHQKSATIHSKLVRNFSRSSMENMARSDYGSPQNILELETMYDSSLDDADDKLFSTLPAQPSLDGTDMSSVADETWYEDAIPWNHYMTQSRGQHQVGNVVESKTAPHENNEEEYNENQHLSGSDPKTKGEQEKKEDTDAKADENRNLLANTVRSYINEIEQLKAEKSQLMTSFLNAQRQIEAQKVTNHEFELKLKNLKHIENIQSLGEQRNYEELSAKHTRDLESLHAKHKSEVADIATRHRVDIERIINKNMNEVKDFKATIVALNKKIESQQQEIDHLSRPLTSRGDTDAEVKLHETIKILQETVTDLENQLDEQHKYNNNAAFLKAENLALKEEKEEAQRNILKQMSTLNEIMKNMETLTNMKISAEKGKREADDEILRLQSELEKMKSMQRAPQSINAAKVHETLLHRANYRESNSVYAKTKIGSTQKVNSKADGPFSNLKRNLMKTIVKNGIFRKEELNFLFRSTLEFTRLDKSKVKAIIQELKKDLDLTKNGRGVQPRSSKYVVSRQRDHK